MYRCRNGQQCFFDDARAFGGVKLDVNNKWVLLGKAIPWAKLEYEYAAAFPDTARGRPAKSARMALGTLLIKDRYNLSDDETIQEVRMNPYLQHFIGLTEFTHDAPIDSSTITRFRKRVNPELLVKLNSYAAKIKAQGAEANG